MNKALYALDGAGVDGLLWPDTKGLAVACRLRSTRRAPVRRLEDAPIKVRR
ncbi:hypothetical protein RR42_s1217 [Cupriavidus basilensis]|uniref:Uncharacterized protein n=1 Tax=Cupriavidus basilensis TaxID=68895 RepID=A0A0C4YJL6_9BURK|nr:hypothetical protein RR42_s1217 [Cupriavidus basilensis]